MAKVVGYFDDDVVFGDEPFVLTNPYGNGFRIEAQIPARGGTPCLPDASIYDLLRTTPFGTGKWMDYEVAAKACDFLNAQVKAGTIHLDRVWRFSPERTYVW
jgi:hypothetical protein